MKFIAAVLFALLSTSAFAFTFNCKGRDQDMDYSMVLKEVGKTNVPENTPVDYQLLIKKNSKVLFSAMVTGKSEDVMLSLRSRRGAPLLQGMIYMDELDQTTITLGANHQVIYFNCNGEE